jgi:hypothetical protein
MILNLKKPMYIYGIVKFKPYLFNKNLWYTGRKGVLDYSVFEKKQLTTVLNTYTLDIESIINDFNKKYYKKNTII